MFEVFLLHVIKQPSQMHSYLVQLNYATSLKAFPLVVEPTVAHQTTARNKSTNQVYLYT